MGVIPQPLSLEPTSGRVLLPANFSIGCFGCGSSNVGATCAQTIRERHGFRCRLDSTATSPLLSLRMESSVPSLDGLDNKREGYELTVSESGVQVVALEPAGLFYGVQTFLQLISPRPREEEGADVFLDGVKIIDAPRFPWRGTLLDVGRHFYSLEFVKRYLDILAMHKINRFHWHLVEDQGWRIEIKALEKLTEVGAWRSKNGEQVYGGFYKQEEILGIVEYAKERFIEVLPEIELPGHCGSALASYPNLSCRGEVTETPTEWGVYEAVYCAGKEEVFTFLESVLSEVCDLFPFEYLHIGGDECPKVRWKSCPHCQARMKEEGLANENELQSWFISRIARFLQKKDKRIIGWDEILEGGIPENATVMSWRGMLGGLIAAKLGHDVIMCPTSHCYLDYRQTASNDEPGAWYAVLPLHMVYTFDPIPSPPPFNQGRQDSADDSTDESLRTEEPKPCESDEMGEASDIGRSDNGNDEEVQTGSKSRDDVDSKDSQDDSKENLIEKASLKTLTLEEEKRIMGGQVCLWTEYVDDEETAEYMLLPRLCAFSESIWSPKGSKDWSGFYKRLSSHLKHFDAMDVKYRPLA